MESRSVRRLQGFKTSPNILGVNNEFPYKAKSGQMGVYYYVKKRLVTP